MNTIVNPNEYYNHPHNTTIENERCIELPLAFRFLNTFNEVMEIGAVTPYYKEPKHQVIDPIDKLATIKDFSQNIDYTDKNVLCISTIEHMGRGDYELNKYSQLAIDEFRRMYNDSKNCLITFPIGYNNTLDEFVKKNIDRYGYFFYCKVVNTPLWVKTTDLNCFTLKYNKNCVIVLTNL